MEKRLIAGFRLNRMENSAKLWLLYAVAVLGFIPALTYYYVGEEAIFPISSLEMHHAHSWLMQIMYGGDVRHNPLFNWLIILFADFLGWTHVLVVTRAIAIASTLGSSLVVYWLSGRLAGDKTFAVFAALVYLTLSDVALYHGWLAYVDPLFSFLVFSAMACLWVAAEEASLTWLFVSALALSLAFLSKAFTAYVFFGGAAAVLLMHGRLRRFLLSPSSLLLGAIALAFPVWWLSILPSQGQGGRMFGEIASKLVFPALGAYAEQVLGFPLEVMLRMVPIAALVLYLFLRGRTGREEDGRFNILFWIGLVNFLPYWLSPQSGIRYIMPLYPVAALVISRVIWNSGQKAMNLAFWVLGVFLVFRLVFMLVLFPWYQSQYRGENYLVTAKEVMRETAGFPLYVTDVSASGLSVTGYLDVLRLPAAPLTYPPEKWSNGFVIAYSENPALGKTWQSFKLGGDRIFLLCRGAACETGRR